jgi:hypothetical protein
MLEGCEEFLDEDQGKKINLAREWFMNKKKKMREKYLKEPPG